MAESMRPASKELAPDTARSYERAKPEKEAGMGRLDNNKNATPTACPDQMEKAVGNRQVPEHQLNAQDVVNERARQPLSGMSRPDHSMKDEEPLGSDQAPTDIHNPRAKRHPRTAGKGGTP